jgi:hypothetical protein
MLIKHPHCAIIHTPSTMTEGGETGSYERKGDKIREYLYVWTVIVPYIKVPSIVTWCFLIVTLQA